ncbi:hypothetical protein LguiA_014874 [Lonicera macranthoides]
MKLALQENLYYVPLMNGESECSEDGVEYDCDDRTGESSSLVLVDNTNSLQHLQSTFLASTRRGVNQKVLMVDHCDSGLKLPRLAKPDEPEFSSL